VTNHPTRSRLRSFLGAALGVLVLTVGLTATAAPASAAVVPTNEDGCPANPNPNTAQPCATFAVQCPKFGLEVRIANTDHSAANAHFVISTPTTTEEYTVAPNETQFHTVHIGEDQTVHVTITETVTGVTFADGDFTRNCTSPSGSVGDVSCADGILVSVSNPGSSPADFHVDIYDGGSDSPTRTADLDDVTGDSSTTVTPADDGTIRIVVTATTSNGVGSAPKVETVADRTLETECIPNLPAATASIACAEGGIDVTVTLTDGPADGTYVITVAGPNGTYPFPGISLSPGESETVHVTPRFGPDLDAVIDGTYRVNVLVPQETPFFSEEFDVECHAPEATVALACATGDDTGVVATVSVPVGQDETHFDITFTTEAGVATLADQIVAAGNTGTFSFASPGEGQVISVRVTPAGDSTVLDEDSMTVDCLAPTVTVTHECGEGDVIVTITNPEGQDETDFTVVVTDGDETVLDEDVTVEPGGSTSVSFDPVEGTTYTVVVTEAGTTEPVVGTAQIPVDCQHPAPSATATEKCASDATNGITVTVTTTDAEGGPTTFSVVITNQDGTTALDQDVTIEGAGTGQVLLSNPVEDKTSHVSVTIGETTVLAADLHVNCVEVQDTTNNPPTEVQGTQTRRGSLATTGPVGPLGSEQLLAVSLGLILAGAGLAGLAGDKRRRPLAATWR
jgi:hypothetical protein